MPSPVSVQDPESLHAAQARSFRPLFLIELWERFGFYGMVALLLLFMVQHHGFSDEHANLTWGAAAALVYAAPVLGGWIGDRVLGAQRTMTLGAMTLAAGYFLLAVPSENLQLMYLSLGVVIVGNGLFKPNAANLVRRIYEGDDARIDSAFTLYYMAINIGSTMSMLATPWIKTHFGWHAAFAVCGSGLLLGLLNYLLMQRKLAGVGVTAHEPPPCKRRLAMVIAGAVLCAAAATVILGNQYVAMACVYAAALIGAGIFARLIATCEKVERAGLIAVAVLTAQTILFFIFYQQYSTSLTFFALRNVDWNFSLFGIHLFEWHPSQFQALNPIWIVLLGPLLAVVYGRAARSGRDAPIAVKFAFGFVAVAAGFFVYGASGQFAVDGRVSSWFLVWGYGLVSLGELLVSCLGPAMVARYAPARMGGFVMGIYFVATGVAQYAGSLVANLAKVDHAVVDSLATLPLYTNLFTQLGIVALGGALFSLALVPLMRRLSDTHRQRDAANGVAPAAPSTL